MRSPFGSKVTPVAICMSDIHFSHKPPVWRSGETDWYNAMHRQWDELRDMVYHLTDGEDLYHFIAGDIFHKWNSPPSLINFAIDCLKGKFTIAIPGQHDLPNHLDNQMSASPFETLVKAGIITNIDGNYHNEHFWCHGYGWNTPLEEEQRRFKQVAMIHRYMWMDGASYQGAPNTGKVTEIHRQLGKPKLTISGDNHIGFWHNPTRTFNCGGFYRLNKDQEHYRPRVGIVYSNLQVIPYYMDTSHDVTLGHFADKSIMEVAERQEDVDEFLQELSQMGRGGLDFLDAVRRYSNKNGVRKATQQLIEQILTGESSAKPSRKV